MYSLQIGGMVLIGLNILISWASFQQESTFYRLQFRVGDLKAGQLYRLLSSGFVHVDWTHLFFNLFSFYIFAGRLEYTLGLWAFVGLYFVSLVGGNLLAWLFHRTNSEYRAVGASGAVSGIIFAFITLFPEEELSLLFLPFFIPAWVYGLLFIVYSIYGIGRQNDNIGHEAHLGGAITGLLFTLVLVPQAAEKNTLTILYLLVPSLAFLIVSFFRPQLLQWNYGGRDQAYTQDDIYRARKAQEEAELNRILEKVKRSGSDSLTAQERRFLEDHF